MFWYIILTLLLLSIMVVIHELGHFLFAKLFGVKVLEFSVGMGPAIYTTKKKKKNEQDFEISEQFKFGEENPQREIIEVNNTEADIIDNKNDSEALDIPENTVFSVRALPIGGYVSMLGEDGNSDDPGAYCNKKSWQKIIISFAGPAMNIILGILCMCLLVGMDAYQGKVLASNTVGEFVTKVQNAEGETIDFTSTSDKCANPLMVGDKIVKVDGVAIHTGNELVYEISHKAHKPIDLVVERNGQRITLENVIFPTYETQGVTFGEMDFKVYGEKASFTNIFKHAFFRSFSTVKMVVDSIVDMFSGRYGIEAVSGPVGVASAVEEAANAGFYSLLYLFTFITMNLGIFNLLPFPALDGGHLVFHFYELIFRKPVKKEFEQMVNLIGIMLLMGFALLITFKDIFTLFK